MSIPDPTVVVKGLTKLTRKVLGPHSDLAFRISLARSTLLLDSVPNRTIVGQFADHFLAELEQLHLQERKKKEPAATTPEVKAKEMRTETEKGKAKGKGKEKRTKGDRREGAKRGTVEGEDPPKCRFYLSEQGCRRVVLVTGVTTSQTAFDVVTLADRQSTLCQNARVLHRIRLPHPQRDQRWQRPRRRGSRLCQMILRRRRVPGLRMKRCNSYYKRRTRC